MQNVWHQEPKMTNNSQANLIDCNSESFKNQNNNVVQSNHKIAELEDKYTTSLINMMINVNSPYYIDELILVY